MIKELKDRLHLFERRFNTDLQVHEIYEVSSGRVKACTSDPFYAVKLLMEFDGVYHFKPAPPIQLSFDF